MKAVGIIVEFNPLHDGHKYLIRETIKKFPNHIIIVVMSGDVVQRGEFSIYNKFHRTKLALENNIDIVIELPSQYVLNNADIFAKGAIKLLNNFDIDQIIFGSETGDLNKLMEISKIIMSENFEEEMKKMTKKTNSYPKAFQELINYKLQSNDILAIRYIYEINKNNFDININCIKRNKKYISATKIRKKIISDDNGGTIMDEYWEGIKAKLISTESDDDLIKYLQNKISDGCYVSWYSFVSGAANKSYSKSRISRELLKWIINIKETNTKSIRILGASKNGLKYLKNKKNYSTKFIPENKNEEKISKYISLKNENYFDIDKKTSIIIK